MNNDEKIDYIITKVDRIDTRLDKLEYFKAQVLGACSIIVFMVSIVGIVYKG